LAYCCGRCGTENSCAVTVWCARDGLMRIFVAVDDILPGPYEYVGISPPKTLNCGTLRHIYAKITSGKSSFLTAAGLYSTGVATNILEALESWNNPARNRRARREVVTGARGRTGASGVAPTLTGKDCENTFFLWAFILRTGRLELSSEDACAAVEWGSGCGHCCQQGFSWLDNYFKMPTCRRPRCQ
jgi:hypothetical protein